MSTNSQTQLTSRRAEVVDAVRAELARKRIAGTSLPRLVGGSKSAWARRLSGETPLDVDDLLTLADLLDVSVGVFFGIEPTPPRRPGGSTGRRLTGPYAGQLVLLPDPTDLHQEFIAQPDAA